MLDVVGVGWPNVDEDAYRDMADALREFADDADGDGHTAHQYVQRLLSSGQSESLTALDRHWSKVQGKHQDLASAARIVAGALDRVADIIVARKIAAVGELADLCATIGVTLAFAPVTAGLSTLLAGGKIVATRIAFKRILKEMAEAAVSEIVATLTQPAVVALETIVADLAVQAALSAAGADGMQLASAGGPGGPGAGAGAGAGPVIDHDAHTQAGSKLAGVQVSMRGKTGSKLDRAKSHHGRAKGKDSLTAVLDTTIEKVTGKLSKGLNDLGEHVGTTLPKAITKGSADHKNSDLDAKDRVARVNKVRGDGGDGGAGSSRPAGRSGLGQDARTRPNSLNAAALNTRRSSIPLSRKTCENDPVDVATGEMVLPQTDLALPGGLPLVLRRTHLSGYRYGHFFGRSWASTLDERIELDPRGQGAVWAREDGSLLVYPRLPGPGEADGVLPEEGPRLPLLYGGDDNGDVTYLIRDPQAGVVRSFTGGPYRVSPAYWLTEIEDRNGNGITFTRRPDGTPSAVAHDGGYQVVLSAGDARIRDLALRTPDGPVTVMRYGYDSEGNLDAVVNSSGRPLRFAYDQDARITSWTDRNDSAFHYVYDTAGRVIRTDGPEGFLSASFAYEDDPQTGGGITRYTDSRGSTTLYRVNGLLQIVATTDPLGATASTEYGEDDRVLSATDPLGHTTRLEYDDAGRPTALIRADGRRTTVTYNALGLPSTLTEPDGAIWQHAYDHRGNRTALTDPAGATTAYAYDGHGAVTSVTDPLGQTVRFDRSPAGLAVAVTDPAGAVTEQHYDAFGRLVCVTNPLGGTTRLSWSVEGHLTSRTNPAGHTEAWAYDGEGNCTAHTDPLGQVTAYEYTHFDLPAACTSPSGARQTFVHDSERRLTQVTNPQGLTWTYGYDRAGRLVSETDFDGHTSSYGYDPAGHLTSRVTANGEATAYRYDAVGNLTGKNHDGAAVHFEHDACGRLLRATGPDAVLEYAYDAVGRVVAESVDSRTLTTACDPAGRRTLRTTPTGAVTAYTYDTAGHRATLTASGRTMSFEHNAIGRETSRLAPSFALTHTWTPAGQMSGQTLTTPCSPGPARHRAYAYRPDGRLTGVTDGHTGPRDYTLDTAGRVTEVGGSGWHESYAYDEAGNQTLASWPRSHPGAEAVGERSYDGSRLVRAGGVRYEHDAQGRVIMRQKTRLSRKPDTWRYTWDAEDRLTAVITPDGTRWRYLYDPLGRRVAKQRLSGDGSVAEETRFVWDGTTLTEQTTRVAGSPETLTLTWDHAGHTPLTQVETKSVLGAPQDVIDQRFFSIVTDQIGTPTELVDEEGEIAWHTRSTLWGSTVWSRDATAHTPLRFPGQYFDPETGLHHNYFRHYDPETARYLTLDPLGLAAAPNPHAYVDNPLTLSDPLGLAPCDENDVTWGGRVQYGAPGPGGRATTMRATIEPGMTGGVTNPSVKVPGYVKYQKLHKTHLLGAQLGGSNKDSRNFVTMHRFANTPVMKKIEDQIRKEVDRGETVEYSVTPVYASNDATDVVPIGLTLEARSSNGFQFTPYGAGSETNLVTILNVPKRTAP